jgi:hypothetical protein
MRTLLLLIALLAIALVIWAAYRAASRRALAARTAGDHYRVLESTGEGQAHVFVSRGTAEGAVLIGSVALNEEDFDERYAELVALAEDRVATLNASRRLHP